MSLLKNISIVIALVAVIYIGYSLFISKGESALDIGSGMNEGHLLASEFLMRLNEIERISFSRDFFEDARFRSLVSFSTVPEPVSAGRSNPFSR